MRREMTLRCVRSRNGTALPSRQVRSGRHRRAEIRLHMPPVRGPRARPPRQPPVPCGRSRRQGSQAAQRRPCGLSGFRLRHGGLRGGRRLMASCTCGPCACWASARSGWVRSRPRRGRLTGAAGGRVDLAPAPPSAKAVAGVAAPRTRAARSAGTHVPSDPTRRESRARGVSRLSSARRASRSGPPGRTTSPARRRVAASHLARLVARARLAADPARPDKTHPRPKAICVLAP